MASGLSGVSLMRMSVLMLAPACDMASAAVRAIGRSLASCVAVLERFVVTRRGGAKFLQLENTSIMTPANAMRWRCCAASKRILGIKLPLAPEEAPDHAQDSDERQRALKYPRFIQPPGDKLR